MTTQLSIVDKFLVGLDKGMRTLHSGATQARRARPMGSNENSAHSEAQKKHIAGLMRINHTGEVCAQALYQGQGLAARDPDVKQSMQESAIEEEDHLAWCEQRLEELGEKTSILNPIFYGLSFGIGVTASIIGDEWSLGFIAATEDQVCKHLEDHLSQIGDSDANSSAILSQMLIDERHHGQKAIDAGGLVFTDMQKRMMTVFSKVMTSTTYHV